VPGFVTSYQGLTYLGPMCDPAEPGSLAVMHTTRRSFLTLTAAAGLLLATPAAAATRAHFTLPRPSGPHPVGVRQRHLVQHGRADPWRPDVVRELMISIWYPAHHRDRPRAPYLDPLVARKYTTDGFLGVPSNEVDWTTPTVTARRNAPANGCHPLVVYTPGGGNSRALGRRSTAACPRRDTDLGSDLQKRMPD
jgi:hypothetical protein